MAKGKASSRKKKPAARKSATRAAGAGRARKAPGPKKRSAARKPAARVKKASGAGKRPAGARSRSQSGFLASDLMARDVLSVSPGTPVSDVSALFKMHNIKGAPVVERNGDLVGIITEDDLIFGQLGIPDEERERLAGSGPGVRRGVSVIRRVAEIMTQNPIAAAEDTPVEDLCRLMSRLKIHRIPILRGRQVVGIVSTIDICRILGDGEALLVRA
jgi:CBS domain-containing protein